MREPLNQPPLIQLQGVERHYQCGEQEVTVLHSLDLTIQAGEMIATSEPPAPVSQP